MHRANAVTLSTAGRTPTQMTEDHFRINIAAPFLDDVLNGLRDRYMYIQYTYLYISISCMYIHVYNNNYYVCGHCR